MSLNPSKCNLCEGWRFIDIDLDLYIYIQRNPLECRGGDLGLAGAGRHVFEPFKVEPL